MKREAESLAGQYMAFFESHGDEIVIRLRKQRLRPPQFSGPPTRRTKPTAIADLLPPAMALEAEDSPEGLISRISAVCGGLDRSWVDWWHSVLALMGAAHTPLLSDFIDKVHHAENCADPRIRASKDLGELHSPERWLVKQATDILKEAGQAWPSFPKTVINKLG